jgi:hypothetical protein
MKNINSNINNFLAYMNIPLTEEEINLVYKANNVNYERCILYYDFLESLFTLIYETYLGEELIYGEQEIKHFNWCLNKIVENFKAENIHFKIKKNFKDIAFLYVKDIFYDQKEKEINGDKMCKFWNHVFKYDGMKTKSDLDAFIEMYKILDYSLLSK